MSRIHLDNSYHDAIPKWQIAATVAIAKQLGFQPADIQDALQEVAIELMAFTYDPSKGGNERAMIRALIRNTLINLVRSQARYAKTIESYRGSLTNSSRTADETDVADLWDFVGSLDPQDQAVCRCLSQGMSTNEIARELAMSWFMVDRAIVRIRTRFQVAGVEVARCG